MYEFFGRSFTNGSIRACAAMTLVVAWACSESPEATGGAAQNQTPQQPSRMRAGTSTAGGPAAPGGNGAGSTSDQFQGLNGMGSGGVHDGGSVSAGAGSSSTGGVIQGGAPSVNGGASANGGVPASGGTMNAGGTPAPTGGTSASGGQPIVLGPTGCAAFDAPNTCGNGTIEPGEDCDGANLRGATSCRDIDPYFTGGMLACDTCAWDLSHCWTNGMCGNGVVDPGEDCEPALFSTLLTEDKLCSKFPPHTGPSLVQCGATSCLYDFGGCDGAPAPVCGNGIVEENEQCDGRGRRIPACVELSPAYVAGVLGCHDDCSFDISQCERCDGAKCGNGLAEGTEACDGNDLRGQSCQSIGWLFGTLKCSPICNVDDSGCTGGCVPGLFGITCR
jgi:hypothetical protein